VLVAATGLLAWGTRDVWRMPVDVFPDLTAPTVTVLTEAHGLSALEVERLVTVPLESALSAASGKRRVRSSSAEGLSVVWVEFSHGVDIYRARQIVAEKLQLAAGRLPRQVDEPVLAPITSIMGEIMFIALTSKKNDSVRLRELADRQIRRRLLQVPGVAQVAPIGGHQREYQVRLEPSRLQAQGLTPDQVIAALRRASRHRWGGLLVRGGVEYSIEGMGRLGGRSDLAAVVVTVRKGVPVRVGDLGTVRVGPAFRRGVGSFNGKPAVVIGILKQPSANTLELTREIDRVLNDLQRTLPKDLIIERKGFRQAAFIQAAVSNVQRALLEGAVLVLIVLALFLLSARATFISVLSIPLSVLTTLLVLRIFGETINTMTLGGIAMAVGALVDDAVIDVENIFRRLRENSLLPDDAQRPQLTVVFGASREIRSSIVFATLILMLVFVPLFFLSGVEGRLLRPLGAAYVLSILSSLVVALTVTPALASLLMGRRGPGRSRESFIARGLKRAYQPVLAWCLRHPWPVILPVIALTVVVVGLGMRTGRAFLPEFNEGSLTLSVVTVPGTSLEMSDEMGRQVERVLHDHPEVVSTTRRTGRAELDEHTLGVYSAEIDVVLQMRSRSMPALLASLRKALGKVPGIVVNIGQPISHRINHMLSGTRSAIAVKLFGPDLDELRLYGERIREATSKVEGAVDVSLEPMVRIPQVRVLPRKEIIARFGMAPGDVVRAAGVALAGEVATELIDGSYRVPVRVSYATRKMDTVESLKALPIMTPGGAVVPLGTLARVRHATGPVSINREGGQRRIVVSANVTGGDLVGVLKRIQAAVGKIKLPRGYRVAYGGQFKREAAARQTLLGVGLLVVIGIFLLLYLAFGSARATVLILANLPFALVGGLLGILATDRIVSIASIVGFIALFGIATRNGILLISHYQHLQTEEGETLTGAVLRGSLERLNPVLMTALTTGLAIIPLIVFGDQPGNELERPMALVIAGGLVSSTVLNMLVLPVLAKRFLKPSGDPTELTPAAEALPESQPADQSSEQVNQ